MSKKHKLLADLESEVDRGFIEETVEHSGHKYTLRTLNDGESNWKNQFVDIMGSAANMLSSQKAPTLAISVRAVDGVSVTDMFRPDKPEGEENKEDREWREYLSWETMRPFERQIFCAKKLLEWFYLRPNEYTSGLFEHYQKLEERRREVITNIKN